MTPAAQVADELTPYQLTIAGLTYPWYLLAVLNGVLSLAFALIAGPWLGILWLLTLSAADQVQQRLYKRWTRTAATTETKAGLRRVALLLVAKSIVWFVTPTAFTLAAHSHAGRAFVAVTAVTLVSLAASSARNSRLVFMAMTVPAAVAMAATAFAVSNAVESAGVLVGICVLIFVLWRVASGTSRVVSDWNSANYRTSAALAETKAALAETKAVERRLRMALEIANLHVYELDYVAHTLSSVGPSADFHEQTPTYKEIRANPLLGVAPEHLEAVAAAYGTALQDGTSFRAEYRVDRTDGREVWASATAELISDAQGNPISLIGALQNITARKRSELDIIEALERAEAASLAKSEFLATISHEIRTPLNGVLGMAQAMEADELPPAQRKRLEVIRRSGESLLVLLNSVLDLSKIEAGKLELEEGEVDVADRARVAMDAFSAAAAAKGLELALHIAPNAQGVFVGDAVRVGQVLYNLVSNAVKFTERGSVTLTVDRPADDLIICVADTGIGISPEQSDSLFEKFVQADASVTRRYGGSGLGLAISRELVVRMGGSIALDSVPGRGSTFTVTLKLVRLRQGEGCADAWAAPAQEAGVEPASLRVLAAEDNPVNQLVLTAILEPVGIVPVMFDDGLQALNAWREGAWDLILMDIQMPVMDGVTATQAIRAEELALGRARTPIIGVTANVMAHQLQAYRAAGMDAVVSKPIEFRRLLEVIEATLAPDGHSPSLAA